MKKYIYLIIIVFFTACLIQNPIVYAAPSSQEQQDQEIDDSFVSEAFKATGDFLKEDLPEDDVGIITDSMLYFIKRGMQAFNRILIVALAGIGAIAFALSGIKYFISVSDPKKLKEARDTLNTTLRGLGFGFGAFIIWEVAMGVVNLIIDAMAK